MKELTPAPSTEADLDYWESWSDDLGLPQGSVYDSQSYQNSMWNRLKNLRRHQNISIAQGRVNGQYIDHGNKRK